LRAAAAWLVALVALFAAFALGAAVVGLVLLAAPAALLAGHFLKPRRTAPQRRATRGAVYEGEFRVLEETCDERP
jgi:membrane protein implicated in regulation of membrane protease activity